MRELLSDFVGGLRSLSPKLFPYRRFAFALLLGGVGGWLFLQARLPHQSAHEVIALGKRYPAEEALERRIVDRALPEDEVLPAAIALAAEFAGKAKPAMRTLKEGMYPRVLGALAQPMSSVPGM